MDFGFFCHRGLQAMLLALLLIATPDANIDDESYATPRYEVVVCIATDCPLAKLYVNRLNDLADRYPQFHVQGVCATEHQSAARIEHFSSGVRFSFRQDVELIRRLGATRSPEAFVLVNGNVVYRGRIDDQYAPGTNRSQPTRRDLEIAIEETLAEQPVGVPQTVASGCLLNDAAAT